MIVTPRDAAAGTVLVHCAARRLIFAINDQ
jgi:hypothetical protein